MSSRRFVELAVRAGRFALAPHPSDKPNRPRASGRRQVGEGMQFSFRLAFIIDLAYVTIGAVGAGAVTREALSRHVPAAHCAADSLRPNQESLGSAITSRRTY